MSAAPVSKDKAPEQKKKTPIGVHLLAGGGAGLSEALVCHPLDTIKVRMQLSRSGRGAGGKGRGFIATGRSIVAKESPLGLYKGLGAVVTGIVPKMAIRFASFEAYKDFLKNKETGKISSGSIFLAGLGAGVTEAVIVVGPMEVVKIRLQAQVHSMTDPLDVPKYRNAGHALYVILREEGPKTLYRGVGLTALRQATNQAANFTAYTELKRLLQKWQPQYPDGGLPAIQTSLIGLISGAMGPFTNAPIDTIKTRIQRATALKGETAWTRITSVSAQMFKEEGFKAFYKGITPRVARVAPGQAVVFTVYERIKTFIEKPAEQESSYSE
ncbi:mitochondrial carrier domain-containing protein [Leucosporidium creatinivorum]|uniref:Mitochondrial carrier domain-containing protein n=1 Tax=Leucosporidium creatinivorum TaxID=106004 RepID=A0A1Y2G0I2_9BASI|nr:mitochondrial carrier domain-containing protein [Leucosporidium creatinivorum]